MIKRPFLCSTLFAVTVFAMACLLLSPSTVEAWSKYDSYLPPDKCFISESVTESDLLSWSIENRSKYWTSYTIVSEQGRFVKAGTLKLGESTKGSKLGVDLLRNKRCKSERYLIFLYGSGVEQTPVTIKILK